MCNGFPDNMVHFLPKNLRILKAFSVSKTARKFLDPKVKVIEG